MLNRDVMNNEISLWIIKIQTLLTKFFRLKIIASFSIFFCPIVISGCIIQNIYKVNLFSRGNVLVFIWLGISPFLIQYSLSFISSFFYTHKHLFENEAELEQIRNNEIKRIQSSKYLFFGIPWSIIITVFILLTTYNESALTVQIWAAITFFIIFLLSSIGFYGMFVLLTMMTNICKSHIVFNPYHPDRFGGLSEFGRFSVKGALLFSTGALAFPLAFDMISKLSKLSEFTIFSIYSLIIIFTFTLIASFIIPIIQIKKFVDVEKERYILDSRNKLDIMLAEFNNNQDLNLKKGIEIVMHYYFNLTKLYKIKDYPWDFKILVEFSMSFIIPIGIAIMQLYFN